MMKKLFKKKPALEVEKSSSERSSSGYEATAKKDLPKLHNAAREGNLARLKTLLKKGDINQLDKDNRTALHLACAVGKLDAVRLLVNHPDCQLNICDNEKNSPLMKCVQCQYEKCLDLLLMKHADVTLSDLRGNTALHLAATIPSKDLCYLLLDNNADVNAENEDGSTPLHQATSISQSEEVVTALLEHGAMIDAQNLCGKTSLMLASSRGCLENIRLLLKKEADVTIRDSRGWTAEDHARMSGYHTVAHIIDDYSVKLKRHKNSGDTTLTRSDYNAGSCSPAFSESSRSEDLSKTSDEKVLRDQFETNPTTLEESEYEDLLKSKDPFQRIPPQSNGLINNSENSENDKRKYASQDDAQTEDMKKEAQISTPIPQPRYHSKPEVSDLQLEEIEESSLRNQFRNPKQSFSLPGRFTTPNRTIMAELGLDDDDLHDIYASDESVEFSSPTPLQRKQLSQSNADELMKAEESNETESNASSCWDDDPNAIQASPIAEGFLPPRKECDSIRFPGEGILVDSEKNEDIPSWNYDDKETEEDIFGEELSSDEEGVKRITPLQKKLLTSIAVEAANMVKKRREREALKRSSNIQPIDEGNISTHDEEEEEKDIQDASDELTTLSGSEVSEVKDFYVGNTEADGDKTNGDIRIPTSFQPYNDFDQTLTQIHKLSCDVDENGEDENYVITTSSAAETDSDEDQQFALPRNQYSLLTSSTSEVASKGRLIAVPGLRDLDNANRKIRQLEEKLKQFIRLEKDWDETSMNQESMLRRFNHDQTQLKEQFSSIESELKMAKERVDRKNEQLQVEERARRDLEMTVRDLRSELQSLDQSCKKSEIDLEMLRETLTKEQQRLTLQDHLIKEKEEISSQIGDQHSRDSKRLDEMNLLVQEKDRELLRERLEREKLEEACLRYRDEISKFYANGDEQRCLVGKLNEELNDEIHDLTQKLNVSQETLKQTSFRYNVQSNHLKQSNDVLAEELKKERAEKARMEEEFEALKSQHRTLNHGIEELESKERRADDTKAFLEKKIEDLQDKNEDLERKFDSSDVTNKLSHKEVSNLRSTLTHKESVLTDVAKERDELKGNLKNRDLELNESQHEIMKLSSKVEFLQSDVKRQEPELLRLRSELNEARNLNTSTLATRQDELAVIIADHQKEKLELEKANARLGQQVAHLRDEVKRINEEKMKKDDELALAQQDRIETHKNLSFTESSQRQLEKDKHMLAAEFEAIKKRCSTLETRVDESSNLIASLQGELENERHTREDTRRELDSLQLHNSRTDKNMERAEQQLKEAEHDKVRFLSELSSSIRREEKLQEELKIHSHARAQLEQFVGKLQEAKVTAEDHLSSEKNRCKVFQKEIESHKKMWENEVLSRSRTSVEFSKAEKERSDAIKLMEKYKRKLTSSIEESKMYRTKYENHRKQHQQTKERLEHYRKTAFESKRIAKTCESECENKLSDMSEEFRAERRRLEGAIRQLQADVANVTSKLNQETKTTTSEVESSSATSSSPPSDSAKDELQRVCDQLRQELKQVRRRESKQIDQTKLNEIIDAQVNEKLLDIKMSLQQRAVAREALERRRFEEEEKRVAVANRRADSYQRELQQLRHNSSHYPETERSELKSTEDCIDLQRQLKRARDEVEQYKAALDQERRIYRTLHANTVGGSLSGYSGQSHSIPFQPVPLTASMDGAAMSSTPKKHSNELDKEHLRKRFDERITQKLSEPQTAHSSHHVNQVSTSLSQRTPVDPDSHPTSTDYFRIP